MQSFWVYMLRCYDGAYYVGHTDDLEKRLGQHQWGSFKGYTSTRLPVLLVFSAEFPTRDEALHSERQLKGWTRVKKEALIMNDWSSVTRFSAVRRG